MAILIKQPLLTALALYSAGAEEQAGGGCGWLGRQWEFFISRMSRVLGRFGTFSLFRSRARADYHTLFGDLWFQI